MSELVRNQNSLATNMQYAEAMSSSNLLPQAYRNSPANILFALGYAEALGVAPIHAITSIHIISGKPSASADLIAATIRKAGHKLRVVGDDTYAEATLIRADDQEFEYVARWDMDKAKRAGLNTATWRAYPGAMLRSRAITEVARMGATDALFGVIYTPEELGAEVDAEGNPVASAPKPTTKPAPKRKPATISEAMGRVEPEPEPLADLGERRDWLAEADGIKGDIPALQALYAEAIDAGELPNVLDSIRAKADEPAS